MDETMARQAAFEAAHPLEGNGHGPSFARGWAAGRDYERAEQHAELERLRALLSEIRAYTMALEGASSAWFATRSYAKRPEISLTLGDRLDAALADAAPTTGADRG